MFESKTLENRKLETGLQSEFLRAIRERIDMGYYPVQFLNVLQNHGPVITAAHFVMAYQDPEGFETLIVSQRLDLTVEAIILQEPYRLLFMPEVLERAEQKLRDIGYLT